MVQKCKLTLGKGQSSQKSIAILRTNLKFTHWLNMRGGEGGNHSSSSLVPATFWELLASAASSSSSESKFLQKSELPSHLHISVHFELWVRHARGIKHNVFACNCIDIFLLQTQEHMDQCMRLAQKPSKKKPLMTRKGSAQPPSPYVAGRTALKAKVSWGW